MTDDFRSWCCRVSTRPAARAWLLLAIGLGAAGVAAAQGTPPAPAAAASGDDPLRYVVFVEEAEGLCVSRNAMQVQVRSTHPTRTVRVWLDRYVMGQGTGDRGRSDLKPGAPPEPLGCSRNANAPQEWRPVRAMFVE